MPVQKKKKEEKKGAPQYMTTWGDMCTLLLCFFVMLLAMSTIDPAKFNVAASSFQQAFSGVLESMPTILIHENVLQPRMGGDEQNKKMAIQAAMRLREAVKKENLEDAVKVKVTEKGLAVKVRDPVGFDVGSSQLKGDFAELLYEIAAILGKTPKAKVRVEGHTDNTPIHTREFPSNWELSAARALNVVKFLYQKGGIDPARLSAVGYGEYRPLVPNTSPENKSTNRRIEIYVEYLEKKDAPDDEPDA
jgi:chemotaxis protein MotB